MTVGDSLATAGYWLVFLIFLPVAAAIAIGFGSKEIAGQEVELLIERMRK